MGGVAELGFPPLVKTYQAKKRKSAVNQSGSSVNLEKAKMVSM